MQVSTARRAAEIEPFEVMDVLSRAHALEARRAARGAHGDRRARLHRARAGGRGRRARAARRPHRLHRDARPARACARRSRAHYRERFETSVDAGRIAVTAGASGRPAHRRRALRRRRRRGPGARPRLSRLPPLRARLRRRRARAAGRRGGELPADARHGARRLGRAHQGPAARLAFQPDRHVDRAAPSCSRIATFVAERGGVLLVDEIYQGLVYGTEPVDRARPAGRSGASSTASRSTSA